MTVKIYTANQFYADRYIGMWLDFEGVDYAMTQDSDSADLRINAGPESDLVLAVFHDSEDQTQGIAQTTQITVTNAWDPGVPNAVFNDFLWNRTRAYYSGFKFSAHTELWYWGGQSNYVTAQQTADTAKSHIYINPARLHNNRGRRRREISDFLKRNYSDLGLHSPLRTQTSRWPGQGYLPPHSTYYETSCISVYAETVEYGSGIAVTEKTWDPLIRGHFVLPYSTQGFVQRLRDLGVAFPDFINYEYDTVVNEQARYLTYQTELDRLCQITLSQWQELWKQHFDVIAHNQQLLYTKPIHRTGLVDQK